MELIARGISEGLVKFDNEEKFVTYVIAGKRYRYTDPEEQVRVQIYLQLIFEYGYSPKRIELERVVPRRTPSDLADIVVFSDDAHKEPWIVVECKRQVISDAEFMQAVEQGFGNANSLSATYLIITSGLKTQYYDVKNFPSLEREANRIADIPRFGETQPKQYKFAKEGAFDIARVSEQQLTRIFKQAHDALWAGGKRNPAEAFDELDKLIFCKLWDERTPRKKGEPYDFQVFSKEPPENLLNRLRSLYNKGKVKDPEVFKEDIRLNEREVQRIVSYLAPVNLSATDLDSKGRAFETFMGSFFRGEFGQYFTPRTIVQFIVDALPITNESLVLDPACGSGGFLLHALDKIRRQANRMVEDGYFARDSRQHYDYWHDFAEHKLYGIEISETIARTAKMNMIIHDDGHTNVVSHDGLEHSDTIRAATRNDGFKENRFNFIVTNPPFGSSIKASEHRYIKDYRLGLNRLNWIDVKLRDLPDYLENPRNRQSSEILFIEKCYRFLTTEGILAMVVPDGILTNSSLQYVRDWIEEHFSILAVISLPQTAFAATGAGVKSSVIFLQKYPYETTMLIQQRKTDIRNRIFETPEFGSEIQRLEEERAKLVTRGDARIRQIEEDLITHLNALEVQGTLNSISRKSIQKDTAVLIKEHKTTEIYREWLREVTEEYNERIDNLKVALIDATQESIKTELDDYPIFMAIAQHIGFDATGFRTETNDFEYISKRLSQFIEEILKTKNAKSKWKIEVAYSEKNLNSSDLHEAVFFVNRSQLQDRFDPLFYKEDVFSFLNQSPHKVLPIYKVVVAVKPGFAAGKDSQDLSGMGVIQIRPTNINDERELVFHKNVYIDQAVFENKSSDLLTKREVLFNNTNSQELVGKTVLFNVDGDYCCSNHITRIQVNEQIIRPEYLTYILNLYQKRGVFYRICTNWNNQSGVSSSLLRRVKIPCPSLNIQDGIIKNLESLKKEADQLRKQADEKTQYAKRQAEQEILGV